jgi:hypothetical protein
MDKKIIRVFPRKTKATPDDELAFVACPPPFYAEADEVHISVAFTYDLKFAEELAKWWQPVAPVLIGGPAMMQPSGEFEPGKYLKPGYVITSRGCPNHCWFCSVWKREGGIRELEIKDGWNVQDDNLLACSEKHIRDVFAMLKRQPHKAEFTGGLEAKLLEQWHVDLLVDLKPAQMFFAYDTQDDLEPLEEASKMLLCADFNRNQMRCYCLIGYPKDTFEEAEKRFMKIIELGFFPQSMLWKNNDGDTNRDWLKLHRLWARPAIIASRTGK